jgi:hypothetical protein
VQGDVFCAKKGRVHDSERLCRSRRLERAWERAERGLGLGQRAAWAAADDWAVTTVAGACWWRDGRGWLVPCTLVGTGVLGVTSGFEGEGEGLGASRHWLVGF